MSSAIEADSAVRALNYSGRLPADTIASNQYFSAGTLDPTSIAEAIRPPAADLAIHASILALRKRAEADPDYRRVMGRAEKQLQDLSPDIFSQLVQRSAPYLRAMPTGHSQGHVSRDLVNVTAVLHDPATHNYSDGEIFCGTVGAFAHDLGNSVIDRDEEKHRLTRHAELGAWLVGEFCADLFPPDILTISQLAIAAHTKFQDTEIMYRGDEEVGRREPYNTQVQDDGLKEAVALARASCRTDIQSIILLYRHIPLALRAKDLYLATGANVVADADPGTNMNNLFTLDLDNPTAMLGYFRQVAANVKTKNWHTVDDTPYLTNDLWGANSDDFETFTEAVLGTPRPDIDARTEFDKFLMLCHLLEPGYDIHAVLDTARAGFNEVKPTVQKHWATGFRLATEVLYPAYHDRMRTHANTLPAVALERGGIVEATLRDVYHKSTQVLDAIEPAHLAAESKDFPDVVDALTA